MTKARGGYGAAPRRSADARTWDHRPVAGNGATVEERRARGRAAREVASRKSQGEWAAPAGRAGPIGMLERQGETRVPELLPIRYARMAVSPFAFFRGNAAIMAA